MPAASSRSTELPRTFRPLWARRVVYPMIAVLLLVVGVGAVVLPSGGAHGYRPADRAGIVAVGCAIAYGMHRLASVRIVCTDRDLLVVNILRRRRLAWPQVVAVRLEPSAPWLVIDVADGTAVSAMGVQGSDGGYALRQAVDLADLVARHSAAGTA